MALLVLQTYWRESCHEWFSSWCKGPGHPQTCPLWQLLPLLECCNGLAQHAGHS
jgi:hypothetical protein